MLRNETPGKPECEQRKRTKKLLLALAAGTAALALPQNAQAALMLSADINGSIFNVIDNGEFDTNSEVGVLRILDQTINGILIRGSLQRSEKPAASGFNILESSSLEVSNTTGDTLSVRVAVSDTDFVGPSETAFVSASGTFRTALGSFIEMAWYNDPLNAQGAETPTDTPGTVIDTFSHTADSEASSFSHDGGPFAVNDLNPYSMTLAFFYELTPGGSLISRGMTELKNTPEVPEPGAIGLLGLGLLGLAAGRRQSKR